jgi:tetratricopeptide (TPR) repeat protein
MTIGSRIYVLLFFSFILLSGTKLVHSSPGIQLRIDVQEGIPGDSSSFQLIDQREVELLNSKQTTSFQANFTLSVTPTIIPKNLSPNGQNVILTVELITLAPNAQTIFKEISAEDGQALFLGEVSAKSGGAYRVFVTPTIMENFEEECDLDTKDREEEWEELPSSHFFFWYLNNSLADFHWRRIKGFVEGEYRRFREVFGFTQPAMDRMVYYVVPCRVNEVVWDPRFDAGLDPVKNKTYVIYNLYERSLDSPNVGFLLFYRIWGYAPPLLAEGIGGYFSLSHHFAKKLIKNNKFIPLGNLIVTMDYRNQPQPAAFVEACSFVRFLVDEYDIDRFKSLYQQATDLSFNQVLPKVYGKDLSTLEKEWLSFLEGHKDVKADFYHLASVRMSYGHLDEAQELYEDMLNLFGGDVSTLRVLAYLHYLKGEYDKSERYYLESLAQDSLNTEFLHIIGNTNYLQGRYDQAREFYRRALLSDSNYVQAYVKLGEIELLQENPMLAQEYFSRAESIKTSSQIKTDIYSGLGKVFRMLGQEEKAEESYKKALRSSESFRLAYPENPLPYLEKGEVFFNLGEIDSAINYLKIAEFLEDKPLQRGRVFLALGKAYDKKGNRKKAEECYGEVLDLSAGFQEKQEAQRLLKSK